MINIKGFRKKNKLTQDDLATFLGLTQGTVSLMESGRSGIGGEMLAKLLLNDQGWDVSTLLQSEGDIVNNVEVGDIIKQIGGKGNIGKTVQGNPKVEQELALANQKIDLLEKQLEAVTAQRDEYWKIIKDQINK